MYYDVTPIERDYFDLFCFSALKSYKGAFHVSSDYAWWYGYADVLGHLATIREKAERLRSERATRNRTLFMIFTGPLMVLGVPGAASFAWRWCARRVTMSGGGADGHTRRRDAGIAHRCAGTFAPGTWCIESVPGSGGVTRRRSRVRRLAHDTRADVRVPAA